MPFTRPDFAGFEYRYNEVQKFLQTYGIFTLKLTTGAIIHFQPEQALDFKRWLDYHCVENIRNSLRAHEALLQQGLHKLPHTHSAHFLS